MKDFVFLLLSWWLVVADFAVAVDAVAAAWHRCDAANCTTDVVGIVAVAAIAVGIAVAWGDVVDLIAVAVAVVDT